MNAKDNLSNPLSTFWWVVVNCFKKWTTSVANGNLIMACLVSLPRCCYDGWLDGMIDEKITLPFVLIFNVFVCKTVYIYSRV